MIELADGRKIRASDLKMAGKPAFERIEADAKSIRLSGRFPGWKATVPLVSADGKVRVSWTALIRDQANCVRQELAISPVGGALPIKQLTVIDFAAPGAQTCRPNRRRGRRLARLLGQPVLRLRASDGGTMWPTKAASRARYHASGRLAGRDMNGQPGFRATVSSGAVSSTTSSAKSVLALTRLF